MDNNSVQDKIDKMKVDIKTLMSAVKKLEQREIDKYVERLDGKMKQLKLEKDRSKYTAEIKSNVRLLKISNSDMSIKVNDLSKESQQS